MIETAPAETASAMHASEMRGQDMQDAPERIFAWHYMIGSLIHGKWSPYPDEVNDPPCSLSYTRTDLCITEAECQRRIDAAVTAEIANASAMFEQTVADLVKALKSADTYIDIGHYEMARNITRNAIRARGQK